jgi:hypothetical protein
VLGKIRKTDHEAHTLQPHSGAARIVLARGAASVADFVRKIDQVAVPKSDRLPLGVTNWKPDICAFTDAPFAHDVVAACGGRRDRRQDRGHCYQKHHSHDDPLRAGCESWPSPHNPHICAPRVGPGRPCRVPQPLTILSVATKMYWLHFRWSLLYRTAGRSKRKRSRISSTMTAVAPHSILRRRSVSVDAL